MPKLLEIEFPVFNFQNFPGGAPGPPLLFEVYNYDTVRFQSGSAPAVGVLKVNSCIDIAALV